MGLNDLSDPAAVRAAVAEFDRLGRDAFLAKYGIDKARGWLLVDGRGREYDAKAIAGAAHGHQFPAAGSLAAVDFHGGEATARVLRRMGFTVREPEREARNPPWTRDELILALDLYLRHRPSIPGDRHPDVVELSDTLGRLAEAEGRAGAGGRFRNPNGVGMKLGNFARLDPDYAGAGRRGLPHGGKGDEEVWRDFAGDPVGLRAAAAAIRAALAAGEVPAFRDDGKDDGLAEAPEGRVLTRLHRVRERNRDLVRRRKEQAMARLGRLACEACGFDFAERYGDHGQGFIECHHTRPVHTLRPDERTRLTDLALLCANCHRMIHARRPWLSLDELRELLSGGI